MRHFRQTGTLLLMLAGAAPLQAKPSDADIIPVLLSQPAPAPEWRNQTNIGIRAGETPADDAPIESLAAFWTSDEVAQEQTNIAPSNKVRERLLDYAVRHPDLLASLTANDRLPTTKGACDRVKAVYDVLADSSEYADDWRQVHGWLMTHSGYFRSELIQAAGQLQPKDDWIQGEDELRALIRLDWPAAEKILIARASGDDSEVGALALSLLYLHRDSAADKAAAMDRSRLQRLVEDKSAPPYVRYTSFAALMQSSWDGRDRWYLSLLSDTTLRELEDGHRLYTPLQDPVAKDPDHFIPILMPLVLGTDCDARETAIEILLGESVPARIDILKPMLPWLTNPNWSSARCRRALVERLAKVDLPECVSGLIKLIEQDQGDLQVSAAMALGHYRAKSAGPAQRKVFEREYTDINSHYIIPAMLRCDALDGDEIAAAIETYAAANSGHGAAPQPPGVPFLGPPANEELGRWLSVMISPDKDNLRFGIPSTEINASFLEAAGNRMLQRAAAVRRLDPPLAAALDQILASWPAAVDQKLVARLAEEPLDLSIIGTAITRQTTMRQSAAEGLRRIISAAGVRAGVAAAILNDPKEIGRILGGEDHSALEAVLAVARLARLSLPVETVARFVDSEDRTVSVAAERYLESEDSPAARDLIWRKHPGEILVLGADGVNMPADAGEATGVWGWGPDEQALRKEMQARNGPDEIIALLSGGGWGGNGQRVIRIKSGAGSFRLDPRTSGDKDGKFLTRKLADAEIQELGAFIKTRRVDDLAPLNTQVWDGVEYEYLHLTKVGGRRVYMNNPGVGTAGTTYDQLTQVFLALDKGGKFEVHFPAAAAIPGMELLLSDKRWPIGAVWKSGADIRVLIGQANAGNYGEWHAFANGKVGDETPPPLGYPEDRSDVPQKFPVNWEHNHHRWRASAGDVVYRAADRWSEAKGGLWRCKKGEAPVRICDGELVRPVVTPDGKWAISQREDRPYTEPNPIVRIDLASGVVSEVPLPPSWFPQSIAYIPARGKFLISREASAPGGGVQVPGEYRLVDPATGKSEVVTGEFGPIEQQCYRPLQPTGTPNEAWAALPGDDHHATRIGRYDMEQFIFTPILTVPGLRFTSMEMWVDQPAGKIYVAVDGDLLRLTLPGK